MFVEVEDFEIKIERQSIVDRQNGGDVSENIIKAVHGGRVEFHFAEEHVKKPLIFVGEKFSAINQNNFTIQSKIGSIEKYATET